MSTKLNEHIYIMNKMNDKDKLEYAFKNYYESADSNIKDSLFLIIAHLISKIELSLDTSKLDNIPDGMKTLIINSAYSYAYEGEKSLRGPILNIFGEILENEEPYIEPFVDLLEMIVYRRRK